MRVIIQCEVEVDEETLAGAVSEIRAAVRETIESHHVVRKAVVRLVPVGDGGAARLREELVHESGLSAEGKIDRRVALERAALELGGVL